MIRSFLLHAAVCLAVISTSFCRADDGPSAIELPKLKFKLAVAEAREALLAAIDDELAHFVDKENLTAVGELLKAKQKFREFGELPNRDSLTPSVTKYAETFKAAREKLVVEAEVLANQLAEEGNITKSRNATQELTTFLADIRVEGVRANAAHSKASLDKTNAELITSTLQEILTVCADYSTAILEIKESETTAEQPKLISEQTEKVLADVNRKLKSQKWTLRFPIRDVQPKANSTNQYDIYVEPPLETASINSEWSLGQKVTLTLTKEKASRIKAGDVLKVFGTPQMGGPYSLTYGIFSRRVKLDKYGDDYMYVLIVNSKIDFEPGKP